MSKYALRDDDGNIHPTQVAFVDGYSFADRLLEGVMFRVETKINGDGTAELVCTGVTEEDEDYIADFAAAQQARWYEEAVECIVKGHGYARAEDGTEVHWGVE